MSFWTLGAVCLLVLLVQAFVIQVAALSALQLALRLRWTGLVQLASLFVEARAARSGDLEQGALQELEVLRRFFHAGPNWQKATDVARLGALLQRCFERPEFCGHRHAAGRAGLNEARLAAVLVLRLENACSAYSAAVRTYERRRRVPWVEPVAGRLGYAEVEALEARIVRAESNVGSGHLSG